MIKMESPFTDLGVLDTFSYSSNIRSGFGMVEPSAVTFKSWGGYKKRELAELLKECKLGKRAPWIARVGSLTVPLNKQFISFLGFYPEENIRGCTCGFRYKDVQLFQSINICALCQRLFSAMNKEPGVWNLERP